MMHLRTTTWRYHSRLRPVSRRPWRLLLLLIALALALGWWQGRAALAGRRTMPEQVALGVLQPLESLTTKVADQLIAAVTWLPRASRMQSENRLLRTQLARLRAENARLVEERLENRRLRALVSLDRRAPRGSRAARVIGRRDSAWAPSLTIDIGWPDGVRRGQVVTAGGGLVGQVFSVAARSALVVPLWDRDSGVACLVQRSREPGIAKGDGRGTLQLCYLRTDADVRPGDQVVCSGVGGVFPKGLPVGRVRSVRAKDGGAVRTAVVEPAVDCLRLEEVLVLPASRH